MTVVSIECNRCTAVFEVPLDAVLIEVSPAAEEVHATDPGGVATFICPGCSDLVSLPIGWPLMLTLVTAGASLIEEDDSDPRPVHPEEPRSGEPLTVDDLLDLHEALASDSWFDDLSSSR